MSGGLSTGGVWCAHLFLHRFQERKGNAAGMLGDQPVFVLFVFFTRFAKRHSGRRGGMDPEEEDARKPRRKPRRLGFDKISLSTSKNMSYQNMSGSVGHCRTMSTATTSRYITYTAYCSTPPRRRRCSSRRGTPSPRKRCQSSCGLIWRADKLA